MVKIIDKTLLCDAESIDGARLYVNRKRLNISLGRFLISKLAPPSPIRHTTAMHLYSFVEN